MILEFATDRNDSSSSLPVRCCEHLQVLRNKLNTGQGSWQREEKEALWQKALSSSLRCLSLTFVCLGFIILLISVPVGDLGSTRDAFKARVPFWGGYSLCFQDMACFWKGKGNRTGGNVFLCPSRMQGSLPITFDWSLALLMWHLGKLSRLLAAPQGCVCPEAPLFFPTYQWVP